MLLDVLCYSFWLFIAIVVSACLLTTEKDKSVPMNDKQCPQKDKS